MNTGKKRILSFLLAMCMTLSLLPVSAWAATETENNHGEHTGWTALNSYIGSNDTLTGGRYYLTGDLNAGTKQIKVTGTVNLCLNGYTYTSNAEGGIFLVGANGVLNIYDCKGNGGISASSIQNPVFLVSGGVCNLYGGTLQSNRSVVVIDENDKGDYKGGTFNMYGGTVRSYATDSFQGIKINADLTATSVNICGGTIKGGKYGINAASGTVKLSGDLDITGKTADIYLNGAKIIPENLTGGEVGVDMEPPGVFTSNQGANYQQYFYSDKADHVVIKSGSELALGTVSSNPHKHYVCGDAVCADSHEVVTYTPISSLGGALSEGNYYLKHSVTATGDITISGAVNLCLNGRTLDLNGHHFIVNNGGSLTICDCGSGGEITGGLAQQGGAVLVDGGILTLHSGSITDNTASGAGDDFGGSNRAGGGAVCVNGGTFTMTGGEIANNTASTTVKNDGGGGVLLNSGSFTMSGGSITGNSVSGHDNSTGGGVHVNSGTFTMTDGDISSNSAPNGGGVTVFKGTEEGTSSFTLSGGFITGNSATSGGGIYVLPRTEFKLSGAPDISGNTAGGAASNIYLNSSKITLGTLSNTTPYGVRMASPGVFTSGGGATYIDNFTSDDSNLDVRISGNELCLSSGFTVSFDPNGGSFAGEAPGAQKVQNGGTATRPTTDPTWDDHTFAGWYNGDTLWNFDTVVTGNMILTAKWIINPTVTVTGNTSMTYGAGGTLTADVTPASGHTYAYQWSCNGNAISEATGESYTIPADTAVGSYTYSCAVTASIDGSSATASASDNATVTVSAKGDGMTVDPIPDQTYTGSAITPEPVVKDGGTTLIKGTDYTLSYGENTNVGTNAGTVTINFTGNYSGSTTVNFNIVYAAFPSGTTNDTVFSDYDNVSGNWSNDADGVTFTSNDGWTVSTTPNGDYKTSITFGEEGTHSETVYVKDSSGNIYETEITCKLDKTDPTVSNVNKPAEGATWTKDNVTVSFNASDTTAGIQTVTVSKGGGTPETLTGSEGKYTFTATENGKYTVTVTDNAGNTTQKEINITNIDKAEPSLNVSGGDTSGGSLTLTVDASNTGGSNIQSVTVQKDGGEAETITGSEYKITEAGTYTFTATTGAGVTSTVTKTVHSVTIGTDAQLVVDGGKVTKPADPTKTGYTFDCWMNGQSEWNFDSQVTADITLTAKWTLDAPTVSLSADKNNVTYGEKITLTATATHDASGNITYTYEWYKGGEKLDGKADSTLTIENVNDSGSYTVKVTASDGTLTSAVEKSIQVSIGKATPTLSVSAAEITYGQSLSNSQLAGTATHNNQDVSGTFAWQTGSINPEVSDSGVTGYKVVFTPDDAENYTSATTNITLTVNRKVLTPSVASVADKVYDGSTSTTGTIELEGAVLGENPTASGVFTFDDADTDTDKTVKVTVTLGDGWASNYVLAETELTTKANITPKTVGLEWSGYTGLVYNGKPVGVAAEATGLVSGDTCAVTVSGGAETDAGDYTATAISLGNANYALPADVERDYTIAPRPVELRWSASSFTYDGDEKTVTATITNLVPDDDCALTYSNNKKTEHGSYTAKVTALGNDNYTLTNGTGLTHEWSIGKAVVSFSVSGNSHTYDGSPKTAVVTQDEGQTPIPAGGYTVTYDGEDSQTEAGTYDITVTITNGNFCFEDGKDSMVVGQLSIGEQAVEIPTADDTAFTYNGAEQTYAIAASDLYTVSGNVQKDAGTYTVTVALKDKANYTWPDGTTDDKTYTFVIGPKTVTATWVGLEKVYGSAEPVNVILSGLAEGDEGLEAVISGVSTEAGEHPLSASLKNYDIINSTATLRIQQKPMTITVTDNAVTVGGEPSISAPGLAESDYEVVYRDKNGNEVTSSEPGTYEVWVEITNPNYRHPDGSSEKQVGSVVVSSGTPESYNVTFAGSGASGSTAGMSAAGGSVITLPECGFTKPGSVFTGWKYFNVVYKPGDSFTMPSSDVTFTAQWAQSQSVGGKVQDKGGAPVEGAAVSIWQGSNKLDEDVTGSDGAYSFPDLAPGSYNVSVSTGEKTVTTVVTVDETGQVTGGNIVLPGGNISTRVDVTPGSPDIVVGDLDGAFTDADKETAASGGTVEIAVKVEQKPESGLTPGEAEQLEDKADGELGLFVDISLDKTTTPSGGTAQVESGVSSEGLLTIIIPLPTELKDKDIYTVVRTDGATGEALSSEPDELSGEYYELTEDGSGLILHVKESGVYAVGGRDYQIVIPTYPPVKTESENGSFAVSPDRPFSGQTVTITPKPDEGYTVDKVTVTDASGKAVEVSPNGDGTYSFTQPSGAVTITVTFKVLTDVSECPRDASCPMSGYTDLNMGEWYHDGIHYCLDEGLMDGVDAGMFAPNATTSRAMIVTILWRLQGSPEVEAEETFTDVAPGDWYADAIAWAAAEGVAEGYEDGSFRPNDAITREQLAAMLWRYAGSPEADGDLSAFADGADTSSWAEQAMSWAVARGLLTGVDNDRLAPGGQATRAQTATILMRFAQSVAG